MRRIIWKFVKNAHLVNDDAKLIAAIKEEHWTHALESQILWMVRNLRQDDVHLFSIFEGDNNIAAYLSLVNANIFLDNNKKEIIGIGNVCVSKKYEHCGLGSELMRQANDYLTINSKIGILLCKDMLVEFYRKNGWRNISFVEAKVAHYEYKKKIMVFSHELKKTYNEIKIDRAF